MTRLLHVLASLFNRYVWSARRIPGPDGYFAWWEPLSPRSWRDELAYVPALNRPHPFLTLETSARGGFRRDPRTKVLPCPSPEMLDRFSGPHGAGKW